MDQLGQLMLVTDWCSGLSFSFQAALRGPFSGWVLVFRGIGFFSSYRLKFEPAIGDLFFKPVDLRFRPDIHATQFYRCREVANSDAFVPSGSRERKS